MQSTERVYLTKAGRRAAEEEKARADKELEGVARARQMAQSLSEKEEARRKAVEQCERGLELKRQELAQMEKEKDELLASASRLAVYPFNAEDFGGGGEKGEKGEAPGQAAAEGGQADGSPISLGRRPKRNRRA